MIRPRYQITTLENGLTRVFDLASQLSALYNSETGVYHAGFYFSELLEDVPGVSEDIVNADLEGVQ